MLRYFGTSSYLNSISKNALAKLRKKTGYTFANCRKALELHENDLTKAEEWLREQAKTLGWAKATKLEGRPTAQGLIGVTSSSDKAVMVEVNCETDFVARNSKFKNLVETITATCLHQPFTKQLLGPEEIKIMISDDGTSLADRLALLIGDIGENVTLRRAFCYSITDGLQVTGLTHPAPTESTGILLGKYGALVAYSAPVTPEADNLARQLCQHVIGMSPKKIGIAGEDEPSSCKEEEECMIHQDYLLDPEQTVGQLLEDNHMAIVAFQRFECGEPDEMPQADETIQAQEISSRTVC